MPASVCMVEYGGVGLPNAPEGKYSHVLSSKFYKN